MIVFKYIVLAVKSIVYILAILFLGKMPFWCGLAIFLALFISDSLEAAVSIAQADIGIRIKDYQMYLSGERFEAYQGVVVDEDPSELSKIVSAPRKSKKNKRTQSKT